MANTKKSSVGCLIVLIAAAALVFWLLSDRGKPPPPRPAQLAGLWRFTEIPYTVEFRPDSHFIMTFLGNKDQKRSIWNQGAYVVDATKNPAWIDIYGMNGRTFGKLGAGDGSYKGCIRFPNADVAEIILRPSGPGYSGRPDSFDKDYKIVIQRIHQ